MQKKVEGLAALLDEHDPGWARKIDLAILDMASSKKSVLGQLFKNEQRGLIELGFLERRKVARPDSPPLRLDEAEKFEGFATLTPQSVPWDELTALWKQLIEARLGAVVERPMVA